MGGMHQTVCQMPTMPTNKILQQGMSKERLGFPQALVCSGPAMSVILFPASQHITTSNNFYLHGILHSANGNLLISTLYEPQRRPNNTPIRDWIGEIYLGVGA
jgi:hypothetical protein